MKRELRVVECQHPRYSHRVRVFTAGKRKDYYFTNETEALAFVKKETEEQGRTGTDFGHITADEKAALEFWRNFTTTATAPPTLRSVLENFKRSWDASKASLSITTAKDKFIAHQKAAGASTRHVDSLKSRLKRFEDEHGKTLVSAITTTTFQEWLDGLKATRADCSGEKLSAVTRHNLTRSLRSFFTYAVENGWTLANPVPKQKRSKNRSAKLATRTAPAIMLPADVARFMDAINTHAPALVPFWAVKFFAGIRDSEASLMTWDMIDMKKGEIHLPAALSKTADQRTMKIRPNLAAWLRPHVKKEGRIAPADTTRKRGYKKALDALAERNKAGEITKPFIFPSNAARHSFGTFHLYKFRKAGETALQLGHKGNPAMLHEHYANPSAQKHAAAFWTIAPKTANNVTSITEGRKTA